MIATQHDEILLASLDMGRGLPANVHFLNEPLPWSYYRALRTVADWILASTLLVACAPFLAVIALAVCIDSPGPPIFLQRRVGKHGKPFTILKFRTLQVGTPPYSLKVAEHHSAVTRIGRFLRRSGLDELPQLWNVIRGEMAIIGPRPEQLELIELYEPWQHRRHLVRPGITGWWQIHHRDAIPLHLNVDKDLYYIQNQGLWIDGLIVIGTLRIVLAGLAAGYRSLRGRQPEVSLVDTVTQADSP